MKKTLYILVMLFGLSFTAYGQYGYTTDSTKFKSASTVYSETICIIPPWTLIYTNEILDYGWSCISYTHEGHSIVGYVWTSHLAWPVIKEYRPESYREYVNSIRRRLQYNPPTPYQNNYTIEGSYTLNRKVQNIKQQN